MLRKRNIVRRARANKMSEASQRLKVINQRKAIRWEKEDGRRIDGRTWDKQKKRNICAVRNWDQLSDNSAFWSLWGGKWGGKRGPKKVREGGLLVHWVNFSHSPSISNFALFTNIWRCSPSCFPILLIDRFCKPCPCIDQSQQLVVFPKIIDDSWNVVVFMFHVTFILFHVTCFCYMFNVKCDMHKIKIPEIEIMMTDWIPYLENAIFFKNSTSKSMSFNPSFPG